MADKADRAEFLAAYKAKNSLAADGDKMMLTVGDNDWPMPIPLVQRDGKWVLDGAAGVDEIIYRRVGENELGAIDVMYGFVNAQNEYAAEGRDGDPAGIYALKLISDEGLHNGLYWPTAEGETPSPAGRSSRPPRPKAMPPATGRARRTTATTTACCTRRVPNANGGAREYFKDGLLTEGFAGIAWPADYGASGVMTFIVNQDGVVFQKDLGEDTATAVETIKTFDPDSSWTAIVPPRRGGRVTAPADDRRATRPAHACSLESSCARVPSQWAAAGRPALSIAPASGMSARMQVGRPTIGRIADCIALDARCQQGK